MIEFIKKPKNLIFINNKIRKYRVNINFIKFYMLYAIKFSTKNQNISKKTSLKL